MTQVRHSNLSGNDLHFSRVRSASGAPTLIPTSIKGEIYRDEGTQELFISNSATLGDYSKIKVSSSDIISVFSTGSVIFANASSALAQDNTNFKWDDSTKQLQLGSGSVSAPSFAFGSQTTTGVYSAGASNISLAVSGVQRLSLGASGMTTNVTAGNNTITLRTTTSGTPSILVDAAGTNNGSILVARPSGQFIMATNNTNPVWIGASGSASSNIAFMINSTPFTNYIPSASDQKAIITNTGLGVGNITPNYALDVAGVSSIRASVGTASSTRLVAQRSLTFAGSGVGVNAFNLTVPANASISLIITGRLVAVDNAGGGNTTTYLGVRPFSVASLSNNTNQTAQINAISSATFTNVDNGTGGTGSNVLTDFTISVSRTSTTNLRLTCSPTYTGTPTSEVLMLDILVLSGDVSGYSIANV